VENSLKDAGHLRKILTELFSSQSLAVLATYGSGQTYGSVVAFAATTDLKSLLFATTRATRKYDNLTSHPNVALVMDNRTNQETDFHQAVAVTATGTVREVETSERDRFLNLYLSKHPYLRDFVIAPTCALLRVDVDTYYIVSQFQNVMELHIKK